MFKIKSKISNKSLIDYIEQVLKGEGVSSSKEAIKIIAKVPMEVRDALSLLDRMIVLSDGSLDYGCLQSIRNH